MESTILLPLKNRLKSAQSALDGFPWLLATILYTLSWGWSLLRPNTLYWDDWAYIYNKPKSYLNQIFVDTGLPPWRALIDQELIAVGYWTIPVLTFLFFFASGIALYLILKKVIFLNQAQINFTILIFLIAPVNHARISLTMFGYTTSFFLFFVAWAILIRHTKTRSFFLAAILFFWSFMTHSLLFFYLIPLAHFFYSLFTGARSKPIEKIYIAKVLVLGVLPAFYYALRHFHWYPTDEFLWYHKISGIGTLRGLQVIIIGLLAITPYEFLRLRRKIDKEKTRSLIIPWLIASWGLFPYFASANINVKSVFEIASGFNSRHLMLTPLGASLLLSAFIFSLNLTFGRAIRPIALAMLTSINIFFGSQFYLDSLKKQELTELIAETDKIENNSEVIFTDQTKVFNGRFANYSDNELNIYVENAGKVVKSISAKSSCSTSQNGLSVVLKSEKSFGDALLSRNLGLYFEVSKC